MYFFGFSCFFLILYPIIIKIIQSKQNESYEKQIYIKNLNEIKPIYNIKKA